MNWNPLSQFQVRVHVTRTRYCLTPIHYLSPSAILLTESFGCRQKNWIAKSKKKKQKWYVRTFLAQTDSNVKIRYGRALEPFIMEIRVCTEARAIGDVWRCVCQVNHAINIGCGLQCFVYDLLGFNRWRMWRKKMAKYARNMHFTSWTANIQLSIVNHCLCEEKETLKQ